MPEGGQRSEEGSRRMQQETTICQLAPQQLVQGVARNRRGGWRPTKWWCRAPLSSIATPFAQGQDFQRLVRTPCQFFFKLTDV